MTFDEVKMIFGNTFKVDSNVKGAEVVYIVDPYDRSKDIICTTPCTIKIPWEPQRIRANKAKILVRKEGYHTEIVPFEQGFKRYVIPRIFLVFILGIIAGIMSVVSTVSGQTLLLVAIAIMCLYSAGSEDLYVELKKE